LQQVVVVVVDHDLLALLAPVEQAVEHLELAEVLLEPH
jgi:hypothetical protein